MKELSDAEQEALLPRVLPAGWIRVPVNADTAVFEKHGAIRVLVGASIEDDGLRWQHISVSRRNGRMPDWFILKEVKDLFAGPEALALQLVLPRSEHYDAGAVTGVDVAHLWVCLDRRPVPDFRAARGGTV